MTDQTTLYRIERDSLGDISVPNDALYGAQTQRALQNFRFSQRQMPTAFIDAVLHIKRAAAIVNLETGAIPHLVAQGIVDATEALLGGAHRDQFPIDVFQTGSGTSTNMNVNEVVARLASQSSGVDVHPNDHVNCGQSSNDTIPSAIHISAALAMVNELIPALESLHTSILGKAAALSDIVKTGRTHLMDAMPLTFEQELSGWANQIENNYARLQQITPQLFQIAQGGTAVGTGVNTDAHFASAIAKQLTRVLDIPFQPADNFFAQMSAQDTAVAVSGQLKTLAVSLMKISNDLRWMNSGPLAGLGEIRLKALQPGSSIMPGKVNPVIPEAVCMVCAQVIGNDASITLAGQSGNFQLNVMLPLVAYNLLDSISLLTAACHALADEAIATFEVNEATIAEALSVNPILVTALNPIIGYEKAAEIAKKAYASQRPIIEVAEAETSLARHELEELLNPAKLTHQP